MHTAHTRRNAPHTYRIHTTVGALSYPVAESLLAGGQAHDRAGIGRPFPTAEANVSSADPRVLGPGWHGCRASQVTTRTSSRAWSSSRASSGRLRWPPDSLST